MGVKKGPRSPSPTTIRPPRARASASAARAPARAGALGQRAEVGGRVAGVAQAQRRDGGAQAGRVVLPGAAFDDHALGGHAELAGVGEAPERRGGGGGVEVGALQDDHGVVARPLGDVGAQGRAGRIGGPEPGQVALAGGRRRVGDDGVDPRVPDQRLGLRPRGVDHHHGVLRPRTGEGLQHPGGGPAHPRGGPADDRVARHERRGDHQRRHPDRRVGRVPAEHDPVGGPLEGRGARHGRHRAGADRLGQGREGVEQPERRPHLALGEAPRLARLGDGLLDDRAGRRGQRGRVSGRRAPGARRAASRRPPAGRRRPGAPARRAG